MAEFPIGSSRAETPGAEAGLSPDAVHDSTGPARRPTGDLLGRVTAFAAADPDRVFYSLPDFLAASLKDLCPR